ncbi:MAG: TetR/AcrR family transcriptional regulator [Gammaproteobacteria bacterium]|jgi:TetR/AcrR family transcriptional repressor of nem operon
MDSTIDTRQRLLDSAQALIYASSYREVGVQQICNHAGVKKGSFYHFFPSKRDLALAVLDQTQAVMQETLINKAFARDLPPLARIDRFFVSLYDFHKQVKKNTGYVLGCPFGNIGCEMSTQDEALRARVDSILSAAEAPFAAALNEAVASGELPAMDTAAAASALFAYTEGIMLYAKTRNDPALIRDLGKRALQLLIPVDSQ